MDSLPEQKGRLGEEPSLLELDQAFREQLMNTIVKPAYEQDIKASFKARSGWQKAARIFYWFAHALGILAMIFSSLQIIYKDTHWNVLAIISNGLILLLLNYSGQASKEQTLITQDLNEKLQSVRIQPFPLANHEVFPIQVPLKQIPIKPIHSTSLPPRTHVSMVPFTTFSTLSPGTFPVTSSTTLSTTTSSATTSTSHAL